jgi:hypothetical protein
MKNSIIAASMLTLTLALGASAQVNPAITAGSRTIAKPAPATTDPAKATRARPESTSAGPNNQWLKCQRSKFSGPRESEFQKPRAPGIVAT